MQGSCTWQHQCAQTYTTKRKQGAKPKFENKVTVVVFAAWWRAAHDLKLIGTVTIATLQLRTERQQAIQVNKQNLPRERALQQVVSPCSACAMDAVATT
jgi:hypothetical protein